MAIADIVSDANSRFHDILYDIENSNGDEFCGIRPGPAADVWDRFKLWVGNIGANHQPASSLSLESRLAGAAELLQEVLDLLADLTDALTECMYSSTSSFLFDAERNTQRQCTRY